MRLLLDTHVWIWRLLEPERLSDEVSKQLSDPISSVSRPSQSGRRSSWLEKEDCT